MAHDGEALERWTLQDLRSTLATGMQELRRRFEVTEAILDRIGKSKGDEVGVYQRHGSLLGPEKRATRQAWSDPIEWLVTDAVKTNVVPSDGESHA